MNDKNRNANRPSSLDEAKAAARARDAQRSTSMHNGTPPGVPDPSSSSPPETALVPTAVSANVVVMTREAARAKMDAALKNPKFKMAPQMLKLDPGQMVEGKLFRGIDAELEKKDERTGEIYFNNVATWIIETADGLRLALLETAQLKKKLPPFVGGHVMIWRGDDIKGAGKSGGDVADYVVIGEEVAPAMDERQSIPTIPEAKSS